MKSTSKHRTLKKVFLNVTACLTALVVTGNIIANECEVQLNSFLGTSSTKIVTKLPDGVTEEGYVRYYDSKYSTLAELKAAGNAKVREVEGEGIVLMKNENSVLPLSAGAKVSLVGVTAMDPVYGGTGSGAVDADGAPNYLDVLTGAGFDVVDKPLLNWYVSEEKKRNGHEIGEVKWKQVKKNHDDTLGQGEDVVYVIGRVGGEGNDVGAGIEDTFDESGDYLHLNEDELSVLEGLKGMKDDGNIRSITVIVNSANPVSMAFADEEDYGVDAVLWVGSVGQTGLYALGDVLSGAVNPSGSLPDTWWKDNQLDPVQNNFGVYTYEGQEKYTYPANANSYNHYVVYQEGVYLGYKYTETRYEDVVLGTPNAGNFQYNNVVAYPFGYGLSYTNFAFSDMQVQKVGEGLKTEYQLTVTVTNTGDKAGKKAVQVYAQKPYTDYDVQNHIEKPAVEFVGFSKTKLLQPGESETVTVSVPEYFLTSYDAYNTGVYILEEGAHYLTIADDAHAAANNILTVKGKTTADGMTADGDASMVYTATYAFDATTYAKAYGTGNDVTSLFAAADVNRYEGSGDNTVTYYSRSNWEGTVTPGAVKLAMTQQLFDDTVLTDSDLPSADGYEWPVFGKQADLQLINMRGVDADDPQWDTFMDQLTFNQLAKICANGLRMTIAINEIGKPETVDHNGPSGVTQKYSVGSNGYAVQTNDPDKNMKGTCYPCNGIIAATMNSQLVEEVGELIGEDAMWAGYAGLYGTGLNIHRSPYSGRVFEYYSEDGFLSGKMAAQEVAAARSKGLVVYIKHFALNDFETYRQSVATFATEQAIREIYLKGFQYAVEEGGANAAMTSFNRIGTRWAGAHSGLCNEVLRKEWGFVGVTLTDAVMANRNWMDVSIGLEAGNDTWLSSGDWLVSKIEDWAAEDGKLLNNLRTSAKNFLYTYANSAAMNGMNETSHVVHTTSWVETDMLIARIVLIVLTALFGLAMLVSYFMDVKKKAASADRKTVSIVAAVIAVLAAIFYIIIDTAATTKMNFDAVVLVLLLVSAVCYLVAGVKKIGLLAAAGLACTLVAWFRYLVTEINFRMDDLVLIFGGTSTIGALGVPFILSFILMLLAAISGAVLMTGAMGSEKK